MRIKKLHYLYDVKFSIIVKYLVWENISKISKKKLLIKK